MQTRKFKEFLRLLKEYKEQNGDCLVPAKYITKDGVRLGSIVVQIRSGRKKTTADQKAMLNSLGFVWKIVVPFEEVIRLLKEYKEQHGHCIVPLAYITESGVRLGSIVSTMRNGTRRTSEEEKAMLNSLGFVWRISVPIEEVIRLLEEYKEQHGECSVPMAYVTEDGVRLGSIVNSIRRGARKITEDEKAKLNSLGFVWKVRKK